MSNTIKAMHLKELQLIFKFNDDDLAKNKQGNLTDDQIKWMQRRQLMSLIYVGIVLGVVAVGMVGFQIYLSTQDINWQDGFNPLPFVMYGIPAVFTVGYAYFFNRYWQNKDDISLTALEGEVQTRAYRVRMNEPEQYEMNIDGQLIPLSQAEYGTLKNGRRYRIYYASGQEAIASLEPIDI